MPYDSSMLIDINIKMINKIKNIYFIILFIIAILSRNIFGSCSNDSPYNGSNYYTWN